MKTQLTIPQAQDRMLKVIAETVQYYCEDPSRRAVTMTGECSYYDSQTDNVCAVGRCLMDPVRHGGHLGNVFDLFEEQYVGDDSILKPEYRGLPWKFWADLQDWHDDTGRWADHEQIDPGEAGYNRQHCCDTDHAVAVRAQELREYVNDGTYILMGQS